MTGTKLRILKTTVFIVSSRSAKKYDIVFESLFLLEKQLNLAEIKL